MASKKPIQAKTKPIKKMAANKPAQGAQAKVKNIYLGDIDGDAIYKQLNNPLRSKTNHFVLDASVIQQKLGDAISEAKAINAYATKMLNLKLSEAELNSAAKLANENKDKLKQAFIDPLNRRMVDAFYSSREALSTLLTVDWGCNLFQGDMRKVDLFLLIDSFRDLGVAKYCANDVFAREDFADYAATIDRDRTKNATVRRIEKSKLLKEKIELLAKDWIDKYPTKPATEIYGYLSSELSNFADAHEITRGLSEREVTSKISKVKNRVK